MFGTEFTQKMERLKWVFCFVVACFLTNINLNAQALFPDLLPAAQAEVMLSNEIPQLENTLNNLTPGTPAYEFAERQYHMYVHTWEGIFSGRDVEESLTSTYGEFARDNSGNPMSEDEMPGLSKNGLDYGDQAFDNLVEFLEQ